MATSPAKMSAKATPPRLAEVRSVRQLTPQMIRLVLGGSDLADFGAGPFTDHYVKLQIPPPGAPYQPPFDLAEVKRSTPREQWPRVRTYSVCDWDPERLELTIDFVNHGDAGVGGPWAAAANPGDRVQLTGPGGAYAPDLSADWHLMIGDACVIPAISASLKRVAEGTPVEVILSVDGAAEQQELSSPGDLNLTWLHHPPGVQPDSEPLLEAAEGLDFRTGRVQAFVHGEAGAVRAIRRHLIVERGIPLADLSASGYWKRRRTEEGWRDDKAEWKRLADEDLGGSTEG